MTTVRLRPARAADADRLFIWRNDPETRRASFNGAEVTRLEHERWLASALVRPDRRLYVALVDGVEAGAVRLDLAGEEAEVSVTVAPEWRGRGVGGLALRAVAAEAFGALGLHRLTAKIKQSNPASRGAFERAGFRVIADGEIATLVRAADGEAPRDA